MNSPDDSRDRPATDAPQDFAERRVHLHLREIFDVACAVTAPFFDPEKGWGGMSLTMYARQALRERFPELTQQDIAILFSAVQRHHREAQHK